MPKLAATDFKDSRLHAARVDTWGGADAPDYRDEPAFQAHKALVKRFIAQYQPLTSRTLKHWMGDEYNDQWTPAALDSLSTEVDRIQKGEMFYYQLSNHRPTKDLHQRQLRDGRRSVGITLGEKPAK